MADIDVVKKSSKAWVWVLLAIIVLLAIWFFMAGGTANQVGSRIDGGQPHAAAFHVLSARRVS